MVDRLVAVNDADYRLPDPVLQAIAADVGDGATEVGEAVGSAVEARTFVIDTDYANLEDALTATAVGGVLEVRSAHTRAVTWAINKSVTVRFVQAGLITATVSAMAAVTVTASDVLIDGLNVVGTGAATSGSGGGLLATGSVGSPVRNLILRNPIVTGFSRFGIQLEHAYDFTISRPIVSTIAYSGIMILSCVGGTITGGKVSNLTMPVPFVNAYGIALSRNAATSISVTPRTSNVTVRGVTIDGVPTWEGIDTHGGENLTIDGNTILNTMVGIALVGSPIGSTDTYAPLDVKVTNNTIDSTVTNGTRANGILVAGAGSATGSAVEYATATIQGNTIINHGRDQNAATSQWGAILLQHTRNVAISNNRVFRAAICGLHVFHTNYGVVATGNTFEDSWSDLAPYSATVFIRSTDNDLTVSGTQITRGAKAATFVNTRGITVSIATNNTLADGGGNQWSNSTLAQAGAGTVLKSSTNGATPVVRAAAITAVAAAPAAYDQAHAQAMVTAINALITVDKNFGLTS